MDSKYYFALNYAQKSKLVASHIQEDSKLITVYINAFTLVSGFELVVKVKPEYEKKILRNADGKLIITPIKISDEIILSHQFDSMFDFSTTYKLGNYSVVFSLIGSKLINNNTLVINIPTEEFESNEPITLYQKYSEHDYIPSYCEEYELDHVKHRIVLLSLKIVITFNGTLVTI